MASRPVGAAVGVAAAAVAAAVAVPAISGGYGSPGDGATPGPTPTVERIMAARAVPGGVEVVFVGYPDTGHGDPCAQAYRAAGRPGSTPGELVVTVTATRSSHDPTPDLVCNTRGHDYRRTVATTEPTDTVRDGATGTVFDLRDPPDPTYWPPSPPPE